MKQLQFPIYLDNHSTTQPDPRVVEAMLPYFTQHFGNAASKHHEFGWHAEAGVESARKQVAAIIDADPAEIVFTSGATESINLALKGIAESSRAKGNHFITVATEHKAVLDTLKRLEKYGFEVTILPVDRNGMISLPALETSITAKTILVSVMTANNEIGTIHPMEEIGSICRKRGVLFHTDATQAIGKIPVDVSKMNIDLLSFSAHKMYGPKGVGALCIRNASPRIKPSVQIDGGGHERGFRSGTLNVPGVVGFGFAAKLALAEMSKESEEVRRLRDKLERGILTHIDEVTVNGHPTDRLPNNLNVTFKHAEADSLMMALKEIAVSAGSACSSSAPQPSHVLSALGLGNDDARCSIRFGLGRFTVEQEIDYTVERVKEAVSSIREKKMSFSA